MIWKLKQKFSGDELVNTLQKAQEKFDIKLGDESSQPSNQDTPLAVGVTINPGDTIKVKVNTASEGISTTCRGSNGEYFFAGYMIAASYSVKYGWDTVEPNPMGEHGPKYQIFDNESVSFGNIYEHEYVYEGDACTITGIDRESEYANLFVIPKA